ncbi:TPA: hypothetical protein ACGW3M_001005 [Pseudomonas aeruginosa]|nr:hypothetical protein [Pseudomonas aeruginosa]ELJ2276177.1 hypothetical protein [Pseudomonas aeruginosa]
MSRYKLLGINDDKSFCECCGKKGLKKVVWIEDTETGEIRHFGTTCAMSPAKGMYLDAEIKAEVRRQDFIVQNRHKLAHRAYRQRGGKYLPHPTRSGTWVNADPALYKECYEAAA